MATAAVDEWLNLIALGGVFLFGYYLHTRGTFNEIFEAINKALDEVKNTKPLPKDDDKSKLARAYSYGYSYLGESGPHKAYISY